MDVQDSGGMASYSGNYCGRYRIDGQGTVIAVSFPLRASAALSADQIHTKTIDFQFLPDLSAMTGVFIQESFEDLVGNDSWASTSYFELRKQK